ncbi:MAG: hypothetical protein K6L76_12615 [Agarilytica sp.]
MNNERDLLRVFKGSHFVIAKNQDYDMIRDIAEQLQLLPPPGTKAP